MDAGGVQRGKGGRNTSLPVCSVRDRTGRHEAQRIGDVVVVVVVVVARQEGWGQNKSPNSPTAST